MKKILLGMMLLISLVSFSKEIELYVVKKGDTLDSIKVKYGMTRDDVIKENPEIEDVNFIKANQYINVWEKIEDSKQISMLEEIEKNLVSMNKKIDDIKKTTKKEENLVITNKEIDDIKKTTEIEKNLYTLNQNIEKFNQKLKEEHETNNILKSYFIILFIILAILGLGIIIVLSKRWKKIEKVVESLENSEKLNTESIIEKLDKTQEKTEILLTNINFEKGSEENTTSDSKFIALNLELVDIKNKLEGMNKYLDRKENEIKRYEKGYDMKIKDQFVKEIMDTIDYLIKQNQKENNNLVNDTIDDLLILLDNNGIFKVDIKIGESYKGKESIAAIKKVIKIEDEERDYEIAEIIKNGYFIQLDKDTKKNIRIASVNIYRN